MKILIPVLATALVLGACSNDDGLVAFDGKFFRAKVKKVDKQRDVFTVEVRNVSQSLDGARQAGEFAGIEHCVGLFGSSDIAWKIGPNTPPEQLQIVDDRLVFEGVCPST
tara:strand:- start:927 stop:1256 length:330 start_codon:yes stop_codon:yes gene_type:complete